MNAGRPSRATCPIGPGSGRLYPERDPHAVVIYYDLGRVRAVRARANTGHDAKLLDVQARPRWCPRGRLGG
jgi:hypothetical protein